MRPLGKNRSDDAERISVEILKFFFAHSLERDASWHFNPFTCCHVEHWVCIPSKQCKAASEVVDAPKLPSPFLASGSPGCVDKGEVLSVQSDIPRFRDGDKVRLSSFEHSDLP